ncbi:hypothetical protein [Streptomyces canus]|uniref:hypothetical protein n=1 Tax=Streptomyces canus TaxID=58343 RepID=UPI003715C0C2
MREEVARHHGTGRGGDAAGPARADWMWPPRAGAPGERTLTALPRRAGLLGLPDVSGGRFAPTVQRPVP